MHITFQILWKRHPREPREAHLGQRHLLLRPLSTGAQSPSHQHPFERPQPTMQYTHIRSRTCMHSPTTGCRPQWQVEEVFKVQAVRCPVPTTPARSHGRKSKRLRKVIQNFQRYSFDDSLKDCRKSVLSMKRADLAQQHFDFLKRCPAPPPKAMLLAFKT